MVGDTASFHCRATGDIVYWIINNETITSTHPDNKERYEAEGFVFSPLTDGSASNYHNLTVNVPASARTNNTLIECRVIGNNYYHIGDSEKAYLFVFSDLRKFYTID